jgi:carbonic anhydrase
MNNWGFGPAMTLAHTEQDFTTLPAMSFEENGTVETVFLTGWHIHAPSEHIVNGIRTKAEIHLVHVNPAGTARAVIAIRIAPGAAASAWFSQMPQPITYREFEINKTVETSMNPKGAIDEVGGLKEYWTYQGRCCT